MLRVVVPATQVGKRTLCVGLSTVRFRSAQFSSHEVFIPPEQIEWLDQLLTEHPESDGWKGKTGATTR